MLCIRHLRTKIAPPSRTKLAARVRGRCLVYRDERFPTGACDANRSRTARSFLQRDGAKGWKANVRPKEHKWAVRQDVGGEQASTREAQESLTAFCRAQRRERKEQTLTRGDPGVKRPRGVSRGHSSDGGTHEQKGVSSEGPKNERAKLNENLKRNRVSRPKRRGVTITVATPDQQTKAASGEAATDRGSGRRAASFRGTQDRKQCTKN